jgi:hypothetical protein
MRARWLLMAGACLLTGCSGRVKSIHEDEWAIHARLATTPGWTVFSFSAEVDLPPGASRTWLVEETERR